jgi:branched-chain amino acid transport system substrate-binding protein
MARAIPAARTLAIIAAAGLTLTACGGGKSNSAQPSSTPSTVTHTGDGTLKLGTLLPETGNLQILGPPQVAGVKLALKDINDNGGVLGKPVELVESDSGDTKTDIASQSVNRLLNENVDAIIGAASSSVTLTVIDKITGSGVLQVSGSNTSTTLSTYPDHGLYWRTAPSDIYQGRVVGETALDDGAQTLGILALQDAYGTSLADQAAKAFTDGGGTVKEKIIYDPTASEFSAEVGRIKAANPDAIALIGFDESAKILDEMIKEGLLPLSSSGKKLYMVDGNMSNTIAVKAGALEGIKGTIPGSKPTTDFQNRLKQFDPNLKDYSYAGEAYDAVTLAALAAEEAKSDNGVDIAKHLQDVSESGTKCTSFKDCDALIKAGTDVDYDGQSGPIEFDANGDPSQASMGIYQFGPDNQYKPLKFVSGPVSGTGSTTSNTGSSGSTSTSSPSPSSSPSASPSATSDSDEYGSDDTGSSTASPSATSTSSSQ